MPVLGLDELLQMVISRQASDLHLVCGSFPMMRVHGDLLPIGGEEVTPESAQELIYQILSPEEVQKLEQSKELDIAYTLPTGSARFRVNVHYQRETLGATFRTIPTSIPDAVFLGLPPIINKVATLPKGLVLLTGPTGSGKSTTLAVILDIINRTQAKHIITIEDPIEFQHDHKKSIVEQREVGRDTASFSEALRRALRQDPDVILVGEMRDAETIATAITAAETGHLVLSTLHTNDTVQTVDRILDVFPSHQQTQIRMQLSMSLEAILSQQLLPTTNGQGRVVAIETLLATDSVRHIIRKGNTHELYSVMEIESKLGMKTMSQALKNLQDQGQIEIQKIGSNKWDVSP